MRMEHELLIYVASNYGGYPKRVYLRMHLASHGWKYFGNMPNKAMTWREVAPPPLDGAENNAT